MILQDYKHLATPAIKKPAMDKPKMFWCVMSVAGWIVSIYLLNLVSL